MRQVPPLPDPANIKKKDIPVIQFVEERLIKCVGRLRNLADTISSPSPSAESLPRRTLQLPSMTHLLCWKMGIRSDCEVLLPSLRTSRSQRCRLVRTFNPATANHSLYTACFAGKPKEEAYDTAKEWLLENGRQFYDRLQPPTEVEQDLVRGPRCFAAFAEIHV